MPVAAKEGWPAFEMSGPRIQAGEIKTIGNVTQQLRHAVAHGDVQFDSDSKDPREVTITFENRPSQGQPPEWRGSIRADHLAEFCQTFSAVIADHVG